MKFNLNNIAATVGIILSGLLVSIAHNSAGESWSWVLLIFGVFLLVFAAVCLQEFTRKPRPSRALAIVTANGSLTINETDQYFGRLVEYTPDGDKRFASQVFCRYTGKFLVGTIAIGQDGIQPVSDDLIAELVMNNFGRGML